MSRARRGPSGGVGPEPGRSEVPPDKDRDEDDQDDRVLGLDQEAERRERGGRLAPALDQQDQRGEHDEGATASTWPHSAESYQVTGMNR